MLPDCLVLPNMGLSYPLNSFSRPQLTLLIPTFQQIWILAAPQWGLSLSQVLNGGTWAHLRDTETQAQITIIFVYLHRTGWCPAFLSGMAKHALSTLAKSRLVKAVSLLPIHDLYPPISTPSAIDLALMTTLFARFCIPQSTSLFTSPCRPFTSPFPQCQDLLHAPPTYIMTFWLVFFALDWFENGMPVSRHFTQWQTSSRSTPGLFPFILRCCFFLLCLNLAFGPEPRPPYWTVKPALFSPSKPLDNWVFSTNVAVFLATLRWGVCKLGTLSFPPTFNLLHGLSVSLPHYTM